MKNQQLHTPEKLLGLAFITLLLFPLSVLFRRFDSNTLTSWRWTLTPEIFPGLYLILITAVIASCLAAMFAPRNKLPAAVLPFLAFLLILPLFRLPEMLLDSGRYFLQAKYLAIHGVPQYWRQWGNNIFAWTDMPLTSLSYGLVFSLLGESRFYCQLFNAMLFCATLLLTYDSGSMLWGRRTGFAAGLLLMGMPYLLLLVPQFLNDVHVMFWLSLTLNCSLRFLHYGGILWSAASVIAIIATALVKYSTWPMLPLLLAALLVQDSTSMKCRLRLLYAWSTAVAILTLVLATKHRVILEQIQLLQNYQMDGLAHWQESYISTFLFQTPPFISLLAIYGGYHAWRRRDRKFLIVAWFPLLALALEMARSRYLVPFLPFLALAAAYGLQQLHDDILSRGLLLVILSWSLLLVFGAFSPFLKQTSMANLQAAARDINTMTVRSPAVLTLPQTKSAGTTAAVIPILDLYTRKELKLFREPQITGMNPQQTYETSLQFSREMNLLSSYQKIKPDQAELLIVAAGEPPNSNPALPALQVGELRLLREYNKNSSPFRFKSFVALYKFYPPEVVVSRTD